MNTTAERLSEHTQGQLDVLQNQIIGKCSEHLGHWDSLASREVDHSCLEEIPAPCIDELDKILTAKGNVDADPRDLALAMPKSAEFAESLRPKLMTERGFVVLNRIPVERYTTEQNRQLAGMLGSLISPLMSQDRRGTKLYDVIDTGAKEGGQQRRSKTNVEQPFHTDGPWNSPSPALIALFCIQQAAVGGTSQIASLPFAIKKLSEENKAFDLENLIRPVYWNRMSEHGEDELPYSRLPLLEKNSDSFYMRYYADYVRTGHKLADQPLPESVASTLTQLNQSLCETACEPFSMRAGQLLYLNNRLVVHARGKFEDDSIGTSGRHLVRIWNQSI